jgi:hypothetical protein
MSSMTIARVSGIGLRPGVSLNKRKYTREAIGRMVERANAALKSGDESLTTLTHHAAGDDSTRIVGRLTKVWQDPDTGDMRYKADIANTEHGRTIANLLDTRDGKPYLKGVSIRGAWASEPRRETLEDGTHVETGDDIALYGLDYTATPGVPGAQVTAFERVAESAAAGARWGIYESAPDALVEAVKKPYGDDVPYADPGYLDRNGKAATKDSPGVARYPLDTKAHAKSAWSYINVEDNASQYTAAQLKRIRSRITSALDKFGVKVTKERWLIDIEPLTESGGLAEYYDPEHAGSYCITVSNGPTCVTVSAYCIDPHDLTAIGRAAMDGAMKALTTIDPDLDGDMDVPGADAEDTDHDMTDSSRPDEDATEAAPAAPQTPDAPPVAHGTPQPAEAATEAASDAADQIGAADTQTEEVAMSDTTAAAAADTTAATPETPAAAAVPGTVTLTDAQFAALMARVSGTPAAAAPAEAAPAATTPAVTEAAAAPAPAAPAAVTETDEARIERLVNERLTLQLQEMRDSGQLAVGQRKGLTEPVNETHAPTPGAGGTIGITEFGVPSDWPQKELSKYTQAEREKYIFPALEAHVLGSRAKSRIGG